MNNNTTPRRTSVTHAAAEQFIQMQRRERAQAARQQACESGWTGDRCTFRLFHAGRHSNEA